MRIRTKYIVVGLITTLFAGGFYTMNADLTAISGEFPEVTVVESNDTTPPPIFPVAPTVPEE